MKAIDEKNIAENSFALDTLKDVEEGRVQGMDAEKDESPYMMKNH